MEKLKLTHELMASLVDVLPETMTLSELKGIRNALQSTVNNHQETPIVESTPIDDKTLTDLICNNDLKSKKIVKLPIIINSAMESEKVHLITFINSNMINCEEFSKDCVIAGTFYKVYSAYREKSNLPPIDSRKVTPLMVSIFGKKFKNWERERWPGIKFADPAFDTMFKNKVKKPKVVKQ